MPVHTNEADGTSTWTPWRKLSTYLVAVIAGWARAYTATVLAYFTSLFTFRFTPVLVRASAAFAAVVITIASGHTLAVIAVISLPAFIVVIYAHSLSAAAVAFSRTKITVADAISPPVASIMALTRAQRCVSRTFPTHRTVVNTAAVTITVT